MKNKVKFTHNKETFIIKKYNQRDERFLLPLMNKNFNENWYLDEWIWKYKKNPNGFSTLVLLNSAGKIIGQYSHLIKKFQIHGKVYNSLMGVDVFVDKNYQGTGLISEFPKYIHLFYMNQNFFHYGFPSKNALKAYKKSGDVYKEYSIIDNYYHAKQYNPISKFFINFVKFSNQLHFHHFSTSDKKEIDALWNKKKKEIDVCVIRDFEYLNWRILQSPDRMKLFLIKNKGETIGYFSIMIKDKVCYITDILVLNDFINEKLIKKIERFCLKGNIKEIRIFISDKKIKKMFFNNNFLFVNLGTLVYYNKIGKNTNISPYLTYIDTD